jgi:hypothetical protein
MKKDKKSPVGGGTMTEDPPLPAYDEGRVESLGEGTGQDEEAVEREPMATSSAQNPKLADQRDAFISSEAAKEANPKTTS